MTGTPLARIKTSPPAVGFDHRRTTALGMGKSDSNQSVAVSLFGRLSKVNVVVLGMKADQPTPLTRSCPTVSPLGHQQIQHEVI